MTRPHEHEHTGRAIRDQIRIAAPPEVVWKAWTDPAVVSRWFVTHAEGQVEPGGRVTWSWGSGEETMDHEVLHVEAGRRLLLGLGLPQGASLLEITIEQDDGHSVLRLVQSGFGEGPDWDDQYEGMLSGWMVALAVLKIFAERYFDRKRAELVLLAEARFEREHMLELQRSDTGLAGWLARSGGAGGGVGEPVQVTLSDGTTLTGTVLRQTRFETLWSWDEIEGVVEMKAYRGKHWGSKVGVRVMSWMDDASSLVDLEGVLGEAVRKLTLLLVEGRGSWRRASLGSVASPATYLSVRLGADSVARLALHPGYAPPST